LDASFSATFTHDRPVELTFRDHRLRITIRTLFKGQSSRFRSVDTAADYRLELTDQGGVRAVREGDVQSLPTGFVIGQDQLGLREQSYATGLGRQFAKVLKPTLDLSSPLPTGDLTAKAGNVRVVQADTGSGWLVMAWRREASAAPSR
jgi:hypothetical protein